jgi:hypothetical protein
MKEHNYIPSRWASERLEAEENNKAEALMFMAVSIGLLLSIGYYGAKLLGDILAYIG